jgi:hypothetical protein
MNIEAWICGAVITLYMTGATVQIALTVGRALYLAPCLQYNAYWIVDISPISEQILSLEYWSMNMRNCYCFVYLVTTVQIALTVGCALYLAPSLHYNAHWVVEMSPIGAQIRSVEYWSLNMRSSNYIVYGLDHSTHSVNWRVCAIYATKFAL